jgi:hypothetical protein
MDHIINCLVIIRSVGERTEQLCKKLILEQGVPEEQVAIIRESPFTESLRKSFQIGLERGFKWTVCVDADVLLRPNSITDMLEEFENHPENVCEIQGYILDKFFGGPREGGIHVYRTKLLDKILTHLPQYHAIRPESTTLKIMSSSGYPFIKIPYLVGLHDFEQYYRDIFRKCFVQAHKHLYVSELLLSIFRENMARDHDFKIALDGFVAGLYYNDEVRIDVNQDIYEESFSKLKIQEKDNLTADKYNLNMIETIIRNWTEPSVFKKHMRYTIKDLEFEHAQMMNKKRGIPKFFGKISRKLKESGPLKTFSYYIGLMFLNISNIFRHFSEKKSV